MVANIKEKAVAIKSTRLSLKEKAALSWERERPTREAARVAQQALELQAVRDKLVGMFGSEHDIELGIDDTGQILAVVEDLRFITHVYSFGVITVSIFLVEKCPHCGEDVPLGKVSDLCDLGELINIPGLKQKHICHPNHP